MADSLRKVDNLGRIVIPAEQRALTGLSYGTSFVSSVVSRADGSYVLLVEVSAPCLCGPSTLDAALSR